MKKPSPEVLRWLKRAAVGAAVGVVVFVVALYVWFPYERAKEVAINLASAQNLDVDIDSVGPAWGFGLAFSNIHVKTRPTSPATKPTRLLIERASVSISPLSLLFFWTEPTITISIDGFGGHVTITQTGSPDSPVKAPRPFSLEVTARDVDVSELPGLREAINLPVTGTLKLDLELASATGRYANAKGDVSFTCAACVLGDGKTPLRIPGNPFLGGGLTLPKVRVGDLRGEATIDGGEGKIKSLDAKSPDLELSVEGGASLRDPLANSLLSAYVRFKLTDPFLKSAGALSTLLQMAGASGKRPDGFYGVRLGGRLAAPTTLLSATSPMAGPVLGATRPPRPSIAPAAYTPPPSPPMPVQMPPPQAPPPVPDNPPPPPPPPPTVAPEVTAPPPTPVNPAPAAPPAAPPDQEAALRGVPPAPPAAPPAPPEGTPPPPGSEGPTAPPPPGAPPPEDSQ